jgi:hypothetical protein
MRRHPELQDIPGEEFSKDALLWIDTANRWDAWIILIGLSFCLFLTLSTGDYGSPSISVEPSIRELNNRTHRLLFPVNSLLAYNRFIRLDMKMGVNPDATLTPFSFYMRLTTIVGDEPTVRINRTFDFMNFPRSSKPNETVPIRIFEDHYIAYDSIDFVFDNITVDRSVYKSLIVLTIMGTYDHTTFQAYFRFIFSVFQIGALALFAWRAITDGARHWTREQKLTVPLIFLAPISNNPFYIFHAYHPTTTAPLVESVATPLYHAYAIMMCLVIIDVIRNKNRTFSFLNVLSWLAVSAPVFVFEFLNTFRAFMYGLEPPEIPPRPEPPNYEFGQMLSHSAFFVVALILLVMALITLDVTDRFKFGAYALAILCVMGNSLVAMIIGRYFGKFDGTMAEWIGSFSVYNIFTFMLIYYHFPVEPGRAQKYQESGVDPIMVDRLVIGEDAGGIAAEEQAEMSDEEDAGDDDDK